jgi:dTDP-4-dehydrorhamnose 3,5-epimerase
MVKCLSGAVFDVIVDLRKLSSTFGKWHREILSSDNMKMMYIPEGFAHGFQTLEANVELLYLHTEFYSPEYEGGVRRRTYSTEIMELK